MLPAYARQTTERFWQPDHGAKQRIQRLVADLDRDHAGDRQQARGACRPPAGGHPRVHRIRAGRDHRSVVATAARRAAGLVLVPHFPARSIVDRAQLDDYLRRATVEAAVDEVFQIGGGTDLPRGACQAPCPCSRRAVRGVRHPRDRPRRASQRAARAPAAATTLEQKLGYVRQTSAEVRLVTQFMFEAEPLFAWERMIRAQGSDLPIHVGVPGPATPEAF